MDRIIDLTRANLLSLFAILTEIVLRPAAVADAVTGSRAEVERTAGLFVAGLALACLQIIFALRGSPDFANFMIPALIGGVFVVVLTAAVHAGLFRLAGVQKPFTAFLAVFFALHGAQFVVVALGNSAAMGVVRGLWPGSMHELTTLYLACPFLAEGDALERMLIHLPTGVWISYFVPLVGSMLFEWVLQVRTYAGFARHRPRGAARWTLIVAAVAAFVVTEVLGAGLGALVHTGFSAVPDECKATAA
jgi:hypothetical protein